MTTSRVVPSVDAQYAGYNPGNLASHPAANIACLVHTFPTAASPNNTSLTLLLGLGAEPVDSDMFSKSIRSRLCRPVNQVLKYHTQACCKNVAPLDTRF